MVKRRQSDWIGRKFVASTTFTEGCDQLPQAKAGGMSKSL
ncbi:MAG: hypothetical protein sL5_05370 [Candidatus Mesenet longicola]|uniref:Uncharacterized protein n=1 Tax=Candidatus Mesenet longicola TaxID=1892558 RepID=A0A8J3HP81_9RICK|nr:MAG: hypothetical protein sGL2_05640 [Candidatus Mesenet longicola]GHM59544.1 MAG: hypothetical protein sL5_05370 [Candidatus Mesenet longicola]